MLDSESTTVALDEFGTGKWNVPALLHTCPTRKVENDKDSRICICTQHLEINVLCGRRSCRSEGTSMYFRAARPRRPCALCRLVSAPPSNFRIPELNPPPTRSFCVLAPSRTSSARAGTGDIIT